MQAELNKNRHKQAGGNISKAQLKKSEKTALQAWAATNMPKDSLQLYSAVMYFQNALVAVQTEIANEKNYTLLYKFIARAHIGQMQHSYDQAHEKISNHQLAEKEVARNTAAETAPGDEYGADNFKYPVPDFPMSPTDLEKFNASVQQRILKKYAGLTKNVYFYLCYVSLELMDFHNCMAHGQALLEQYGKELSVKTKFQTLQYLVEASCMLNNADKAIGYLKES